MFARDVGVAAFGKAGPVYDVEIEEAVAIKIAPGRGSALASIAHTGLLGHIGESAPAFVVKECIGAVVQYIQVKPAIVVIISPDGAAGVDIGKGDLWRKFETENVPSPLLR